MDDCQAEFHSVMFPKPAFQSKTCNQLDQPFLFLRNLLLHRQSSNLVEKPGRKPSRPESFDPFSPCKFISSALKHSRSGRRRQLGQLSLDALKITAKKKKSQLQNDKEGEGLEDDTLVPTKSAISRVFKHGQATWFYFLDRALDIPPGLWPAGSLDPYITILDVPSMPDKVPRSPFLYGKPSWHALKPFKEAEARSNPDFLHSGREIPLLLEGISPVLCDFSDDPKPPAIFRSSPKAAGSFGVLTMAWTYILSARLLEMQGRHVQYSEDNRLWPNRIDDETTDHVQICLDGASPALVRWLCSLLCPFLGWSSNEDGVPPWAVDLFNSSVVIITDAQGVDTQEAPGSSDAIHLLIELCRLFGLGTGDDGSEQYESLSPYREAFFAALLIPYQREFLMHPTFPAVCLERSEGRSFTDMDEGLIRSYELDMSYFMTISLSPSSVNSILWSVFWQPDIDCNLASPWLRGILEVLEPVIEAEDFETLLKMFALRRPRIAPWWMAIFLLGNGPMLERIQQYLDPTVPNVHFWTLHRPDPTLSAWTGAVQTFIECAGDADRLGPGLISRADLARSLFINQQWLPASTPQSWRPFGKVEWRDVVPELRPYLSTLPCYHYWHFTWDRGTEEPLTSLGFRRDTARHVEHVSDNLELLSSESDDDDENCSRLINRCQSKKATVGMITLLMRDVCGRRNWVNTAMPDSVRYHDWLFGWKGLEVKGEGLAEAEVEFVSSAPSWFLIEWIEGKHEGEHEGNDDETMEMVEDFDDI
ncbi:hypothetical protein L249_7300 [Ophiocordyceps polyrhachis-furcata BCC 54312]|uniref:Uncharacterized protein n=1 Tax=Ophiocordyceps polyrhachis-furcata BCC 54312 TaxID=1330021 RepID=A0A367L9L3_9HYPO|nr:hypothetical protein L249_7300 [Ophiocordyceps polyrhachis-furcata BCC 54312]